MRDFTPISENAFLKQAEIYTRRESIMKYSPGEAVFSHCRSKVSAAMRMPADGVQLLGRKSFANSMKQSHSKRSI